jgi:hypothetical protein
MGDIRDMAFIMLLRKKVLAGDTADTARQELFVVDCVICLLISFSRLLVCLSVLALYGAGECMTAG